MLKLICCICDKVLGYSESGNEGISGGICPKCLKEFYPDEYKAMKANGDLTEKEIAEAEGLILQ